ncbi:MAG: hypothetical protein QM737_02615 [Ferruginibacter sp.]
MNTPYKTRPVRFIDILKHDGWQIKLYSISIKNDIVDLQTIEYAKLQLTTWLRNSSLYPLPNYKVATLILHEGKEGCFAIINWWIDENMLQQFVYLATNDQPTQFNLYSDKGIITCVWEMAVLWFERNAWVETVLMHPGNPDAINNYLGKHLNAIV